MGNLRLEYLEKLTKALPGMKVVLEDVEARLANIETPIPSKDESTTKEKRQKDLEGAIGILRRDGNCLSEKAGMASRTTNQHYN